MQNDRLITISIGKSRLSTDWQRSDLMWSEFVDRLRTPIRTTETFEAYSRLSKAEKAKLKDVGGFVGGCLKGSRRKSSEVLSRDLITLDLDTIPAGGTKDIIRKVASLGCAYVIYSTRSHAEHCPRLRIVIPLDRAVSADEYEPIARKIASAIDMTACDATTFEASRLMYWPSCSKDSHYIFAYDDALFVSADGILSLYENWHDVGEWPIIPGGEDGPRVARAKAEDPTTKKGIVGAFCRLYRVEEAMEKFIPHAYEATDKDDRFTYTGGTTVAGAVVYDNGLFLYSNHATDPICHKLVNAFDLVRLHRFGDLDSEVKDGTPINRVPSYLEMCKLARSDEAVAIELEKERMKAGDVFEMVGTPRADGAIELKAEASLDWQKHAELKRNDNGKIRPTIDNILRILNFDPGLKGKIVLDEFSVRGLAMGALPWNPTRAERLWDDSDDAGIKWYLENKFDITGDTKIMNAVTLVAQQNKVNRVRDYLDSLEWDHVPRLDTVLVDYLGAKDTPYTRAVARKAFVAAVARVYEPGTKWDYVPILIGPQGGGKSTFLRTIGINWFSDSLQSFDGKDAAEMIQGVWINELAEMASYSKSEMNVVKQFLSKCDDIYRQAYGRRTARYPRKCTFWGTSNDHDVLRDLTGNRRFWPIEVGVDKPCKSVWGTLAGEVDRLWAEALQYYCIGEALYMETDELKALAESAQEAHRETSTKEGMIYDFIEKPVPINYADLSIDMRRQFWAGTMMIDTATLVPRDRVCAIEVWVECFGGHLNYMKKSEAREINQILANMDSLERITTGRFGPYGIQRGFKMKGRPVDKLGKKL